MFPVTNRALITSTARASSAETETEREAVCGSEKIERASARERDIVLSVLKHDSVKKTDLLNAAPCRMQVFKCIVTKANG